MRRRRAHFFCFSAVQTERLEDAAPVVLQVALYASKSARSAGHPPIQDMLTRRKFVKSREYGIP